MDKALPRYKKEAPQEELPTALTKPELSLCQMVDGKMILPKDIRQQFLACPVWGQEWREILTKFDRDWGCEVGDPVTPPPNQRMAALNTPSPMNPPVRQALPPTMPGEPTTIEKMKEKYGDVVAELPLGTTGVTLALVTGPALFMVAKEACTVSPMDGPIISHGAGSWLTGEKADKYESNHPGSAIPCVFVDDLAKVVLEDWG